MKVYTEPLSDVERYLSQRRHIKLSQKEPEFDKLFNLVRRFRPVGPGTNVLEIGTGMGWIPLICAQRGIRCKGLEISRQLIDYAQGVGRELGVTPDIELGNIEETDIGNGRWDVIIAQSVFEHVQNWRRGLQKVYAALKPGGVLFFESTNKFAPISGEYHLPFYGWLPDRLRYAYRVRVQGPDIMKLGIDFNQFTYPLLRRTFRRLGFSRVLDRVQLMDTSGLRGGKRAVAEAIRHVAPLRHLALLFRQTTIFICVK